MSLSQCPRLSKSIQQEINNLLMLNNWGYGSSAGLPRHTPPPPPVTHQLCLGCSERCMWKSASGHYSLTLLRVFILRSSSDVKNTSHTLISCKEHITARFLKKTELQIIRTDAASICFVFRVWCALEGTSHHVKTPTRTRRGGRGWAQRTKLIKEIL